MKSFTQSKTYVEQVLRCDITWQLTCIFAGAGRLKLRAGDSDYMEAQACKTPDLVRTPPEDGARGQAPYSPSDPMDWEDNLDGLENMYGGGGPPPRTSRPRRG